MQKIEFQIVFTRKQTGSRIRITREVSKHWTDSMLSLWVTQEFNGLLEEGWKLASVTAFRKEARSDDGN